MNLWNDLLSLLHCYLFCQDEKFIVFSDIHPAAEHHYLVCPRSHIRNAKCLTKNDLELGMLDQQTFYVSTLQYKKCSLN